MDIESIKAFIKLTEIGSISKCSESLFMSQPALSKIISKLEKEMGVILLNRTNKGINLTKEGCIVFEYFKKIVNLEKEMKKEIIDFEQNIQKLKIISLPSVANYSLPCTLHSLSKKFKNIKFPLILKNSSTKIVSDISEEIADIGFVSKCQSCDFLKIKHTKAYEDNILLVSSINFKKNEIDKSQLNSLEFISYIGDDSITETLKEKIGNYNLLNFVLELESIEAIKQSLIQSNMVAFLPYSAIKKELYRKELKSIKIKDLEIIKEIYIARRIKNSKDHTKIIEFIEKFIIDTIC